MARWRPGQTEFDISVVTLKKSDGRQTAVISIPKPVYEAMGRPKKVRYCKTDGPSWDLVGCNEDGVGIAVEK